MAIWIYRSVGKNAVLAARVRQDVTSVMDIRIVLGLMLAAALAGRYAPARRVPLHSLIAALAENEHYSR